MMAFLGLPPFSIPKHVPRTTVASLIYSFDRLLSAANRYQDGCMIDVCVSVRNQDGSFTDHPITGVVLAGDKLTLQTIGKGHV
jgi:hypothetical protein